MNPIVAPLSKKEAKYVYKTYLKDHFPATEVKPWKSISRMWDNGCYFTVGLFEASDSLLGYAFFVEAPDCSAVLLDYYAVLPEHRSSGLGGKFLARLRELVENRGKYILFETEDLAYAKTHAQVEERTRRDSFYSRNGCTKTDVKGTVFGVHYAIWHLGEPTPQEGSPSPRANTFDRCCADLQALYRTMVPGEKNTLFIKIRRD